MVKPASFRGCDVAMMGHLHQFRVLRKRSPVCIYTGSMERSNFGDAEVDKYFIDYSINRKKAKFYKIPVRGLIDATEDLSGLDFADILPGLNDVIDAHDVSEKIIRFKLIVDEKVLPAVDKSYIQSRLYDNGAFHVSKVIIEVISKRVVRDNSVLNHKDDFSMFKAFIESQDIDEEYGKILLEETKIIMGE
jgi:DNA repair exonuclease SbcCD nuclease subunit